jgi:hypothetical protein
MLIKRLAEEIICKPNQKGLDRHAEFIQNQTGRQAEESVHFHLVKQNN